MSAAGADGLRDAVRSRATACGLEPTEAAVAAIAGHARAVLEADPRLHLTSIRDPQELLERHVGESLEGAALLEPGVTGMLVDLGSGNGYPALPVVAVRPGLRAVLVEASRRKAAFLRRVLAGGDFPSVELHEGQVQRGTDLRGVGAVTVLTTRAMGGWEKIVPRIARLLAPDGTVLLWSGASTAQVVRRDAWRGLEIVRRHPLPGRDRSWIWMLRRPGRGS